MNFKLYLVFFIGFLSLYSCSGIRNSGLFNIRIKESSEIKENEVPPSLIDAFQIKYPGIIAEKWYKINNNKYAVSFNKEGVYKYAYFSNIGIFQDEEIDEELFYDPYDEYEWEEIPDEYY
jgi:hypothetical protein